MQGLRRWLWAFIALSLGHVAVALGMTALTPAPATPGPLMPAAGGPLTDLAIQFHRPAAPRFLPVFGELLTELDPSTTVHVVVADDTDRALFEEARGGWFPTGGGPEVVYTTTDRPITSWMRDRLAVLPATRAGDPIVLLAPEQPVTGPEARVHDWTVPWTLAEHLGDGAVVRATRYRFDGGDLIADAERVYVATPLFERNPHRDPAELLADLERDLGRPVLALGADGTPVPDHHIGMFVTPLSDGRVVVGDPELALQILAEAGVDLSAGTLEVGGTPLRLDVSPERIARFHHVADQLRAEGLEVVPMPLLPSTERWVWISYDNVMLEHRADGQLHVYLPTYGVPALDDAATEIWQAQGALVHGIEVDQLFRLGGSVRCLTAPLHRG